MTTLTDFLIPNDLFYQKYQDTNINKIPLLGSHDSASYQLVHGNNKDKLTKILDYARYLGGIVDSTIKEWTITQKFNLYSQLSMGIRALDLRVTYDQNCNDFYFTHTLFCVKASDALSDINKYINENGNSFVQILIKPDFQHRNTFTLERKNTFKQLVTDTFGSKLISPAPVFPTLKECFEKEQQVLCAFTDDGSSYEFPSLWGGERFQGGWIQETNDDLFYQGIKNFVKYANNENTITHVSIAKTPTADVIKEDLKNRLINVLFLENTLSLIRRKLFDCQYTPQNLDEYSKNQKIILEKLGHDAITEGFDMNNITIWWADFIANSAGFYYSWD